MTDINVNVEGTKKAAEGIGLFAKFCIPLVLVFALSGAVAVWTSFHEGSHVVKQINRAEAAQQRADGRVGAAVLPKAPIKLVMSSRKACLKFDSGYLDNGEFIGYVKNTCHQQMGYFEIHLSGLAPDGTIVQGNWTNQFPSLGPSDKAEVRLAVANGYQESLDDRIVLVRAAITGNE